MIILAMVRAAIPTNIAILEKGWGAPFNSNLFCGMNNSNIGKERKHKEVHMR